MEGKASWFGGMLDDDMANDEGLSFYEHWEADLRPDLFLPRSSNLEQGTSKRLRCEFSYYIALNVPLGLPRITAHESRWIVANLSTGAAVVCHLVDRGPSAGKRMVDASKAVFHAIGLDPDADTDHEVEVIQKTDFDIPFGLYEETDKT